MSSIFGRVAFRATRPFLDSGVNAGSSAPRWGRQLTHQDSRPGQKALRSGAKKDPELYILYFITAATLAGSGWFLPVSPITNSEAAWTVVQAEESEPWKDPTHNGKYKYYPQGDTSKPPKPAPSALNTVIVPNVNLPKKLHDVYNKMGKKEWEF